MYVIGLLSDCEALSSRSDLIWLRYGESVIFWELAGEPQAGMCEIARRVYNLVKNRAESSRDRVEAAQRRSRSSISFEYSSILLDSKAENRVILDFTRKNRKMSYRDDENWLESRFCEIEYFISPRYRFFPRSRSPAPKQLAHTWPQVTELFAGWLEM